MTAAYTKVFEKDRHIGLDKLNSAVYAVHEKCIPEGAQGLDVVENYANSASVSGKLDLQTFETGARQEDYEFWALTN